MVDLKVSFQNRLGAMGQGALIAFSATFCADVLNFGIKLILGRLLPPLKYGAIEPIFSLILIVAVPMQILLDVGSKSLSRLQSMQREAEARSLLRDMTLLTALGSALVGTAVFLASPLILSRLHLASRHYIWIIAALLSLSWWRLLALAVIRGKRLFRLLPLPLVLGPVLALGLTVLLTGVLDKGLQGALTARVIAWAVVAVCVAVAMRADMRGPRARDAEETRIIGRGLLPMALFVLSAALLFHFDRLFVRNFFLEDSGGFGAIVTLGSTPSLMIRAIVFVAFPWAAAEHAVGRSVNRIIIHAVLAGTAITTACVAGFAVMGDWALSLWNAAFSPYADYLWPYGLAAGLHGIILTVAHIEVARHRYGFLWFLVLPTLGMCALIYLCRGQMSLGSIVWTLVGVRALILVSMVAFVFITERGRKVYS